MLWHLQEVQNQLRVADLLLSRHRRKTSALSPRQVTVQRSQPPFIDWYFV